MRATSRRPALPDPDSGPAGAKYALTPAGIRGFLQAYRERFGTNRVVDLTLYGDYAIVNVPKPKSRQAELGLSRRLGVHQLRRCPGHLPRRPAGRHEPAGGHGAGAQHRPGTGTLNVEDPTPDLRDRAVHPGRSERAPSVNIYVGNKFNESGYLATTLAGKVKRAYPFRRQ